MELLPYPPILNSMGFVEDRDRVLGGKVERRRLRRIY
jgi:hypothetical protein